MLEKNSSTEQAIDARTRAKFMLSTEGRLFTAGCVMLILWFSSVAICYRMDGDYCGRMVRMGLTHVAFGRAVSIANGTASELPQWLVAVLAIYTDVMAMLITYPLLIFSYRHLFERPFFKRHMKPVFETAQRRVGRMRQFKIVGVFLFVWFPFWMTGIITGAVLGFLLGLRTWVTMITVILGAATAVVCWVYAYDVLFGWLQRVEQGIPVVVSTLLILVLVALRLVRQRSRGKAALQTKNEEEKE